jgi:hypothetical protein
VLDDIVEQLSAADVLHHHEDVRGSRNDLKTIFFVFTLTKFWSKMATVVAFIDDAIQKDCCFVALSTATVAVVRFLKHSSPL